MLQYGYNDMKGVVNMKRIAVMLEPETFKALKKMADEKGLSVSALVRTTMKELVSKKEDE